MAEAKSAETQRRGIFLSYSRSDQARVEGLALLLEALGHEVFLDRASIKPGMRWEARLRDGLDHTDVLLVYWTKRAARSVWVRKEYEYFHIRHPDRLLVPMLGDETPLSELLKLHQHSDFAPLINELLSLQRNLEKQGAGKSQIQERILERLRESGIELDESQRKKVLAFFAPAGLLAFAFAPLPFLKGLGSAGLEAAAQLTLPQVALLAAAAVSGAVLAGTADRETAPQVWPTPEAIAVPAVDPPGGCLQLTARSTNDSETLAPEWWIFEAEPDAQGNRREVGRKSTSERPVFMLAEGRYVVRAQVEDVMVERELEIWAGEVTEEAVDLPMDRSSLTPATADYVSNETAGRDLIADADLKAPDVSSDSPYVITGYWSPDAGEIEREAVESAPEAGRLLRTLEGHTDYIFDVVVFDARRVISTSFDGTLRVWDVETGESLQILEVPPTPPRKKEHAQKLTVLDARRIIATGFFSTLQIWDVETGKLSRTLKGHAPVAVYDVAVLDTRRVVSASFDQTLRIWDVETGNSVLTLKGHTDGVTGVAVIDARRVVSCSLDHTLRVWDVETGNSLRTLEGHSDGVWAVAVIDGHRVVSASGDGTLRVWDVETGNSLWTLGGHTKSVMRVAVIDAQRIVYASGDNALRVWDLETGKTLQTLEGHTNTVMDVAVIDARRIVSASGDNTLRVWDVETGMSLQILEGHSGEVRDVVVLDAKRVVSSSRDGTLRVWDVGYS